MTKKLLLAAAAMGALAFAGAATAADITAGKISGVNLISGGKVAPYTVATEADLDATTGIVSTTATTDLTVEMDSPVQVAANGTMPFAVTFTLTGPATFDQNFTYGDLKVGALAPKSGVVVMSADKKSVSFFVEFGDTAALDVDALTLEKIKLKVTGKQDVSIAAEAKVTVAGFTQTVSVLDATKIVQFKAALKPSTAAAFGVVAALNDFKKFQVSGTAGQAASSTAADAISNPIGLTVNAGIRQNLSGGAALTVGNILDGATATVTGPQVKALGATLAGQSPAAATLTATSGVFTLTNTHLTDSTVGGSLVLTNPASPDTVVIEQGAYKVDLKPKFATGFTGSADQSLTLINVTLAGTNFYAPWFALDNGSANSTLRLGNNGSAAVGPVIISLKANNGTAAPTGTYTIPSIAPGAFVSVRGDQLKAAFGTNAANGDLHVTVQSNVANVSAKVRTTQSTGQIYENSLGANPPLN